MTKLVTFWCNARQNISNLNSAEKDFTFEYIYIVYTLKYEEQVLNYLLKWSSCL